mgnify:CR=1 FL=1
MPPCCRPSREMSTGTKAVAGVGSESGTPISTAGSARILITGMKAVSMVLSERTHGRPSKAAASWYKSRVDSPCPGGSERGGVADMMLLVGALEAGPRRGEEAGEESAGEREPAGVDLVAALLLLVSLSWLWLRLSVSSSSSSTTDEAALEGPVATVVEALLLLLPLPLLMVVATL